MSNLLPALKGIGVTFYSSEVLKKFQKKGIKKSLSNVHWIRKKKIKK